MCIRDRRVNCIQPGIVEGDRIDRVVDAKSKSLGIPREEVKRRMLAGTSLNTTVTAQDIAVCGGSRYLV